MTAFQGNLAVVSAEANYLALCLESCVERDSEAENGPSTVISVFCHGYRNRKWW